MDRHRGVGYCHCHHWKQRNAAAERMTRHHHAAMKDAWHRRDVTAACRHQDAAKAWEYRWRWTAAGAKRFHVVGPISRWLLPDIDHASVVAQLVQVETPRVVRPPDDPVAALSAAPAAPPAGVPVAA